MFTFSFVLVIANIGHFDLMSSSSTDVGMFIDGPVYLCTVVALDHSQTPISPKLTFTFT